MRRNPRGEHVDDPAITHHGNPNEEAELRRYLADVYIANRRRSGPHRTIEAVEVGHFREPIAHWTAGIDDLAAIQSEETAIRSRGTVAHVMQERSGEPTAYVLFRGEYDKRRDKVTGQLQKKAYGGWLIHVFRLLTRLKFLRGTAFDPFG